MIEKRIYYFELEALTPLAVSSKDKGKVIVDATGRPYITGNSIGGALRAYLSRTGWTELEVLRIMGGKRSGEQHPDEFVESKLFIKHGEIKGIKGDIALNRITKTGTAIEPRSGAARENHKYEFEAIAPPFALSFALECEVEPTIETTYGNRSLEAMVQAWLRGIEQGQLRFGGQKNNDFGRFTVTALQCQVYQWDSLDAMDAFLFSKGGEPPRIDLLQSWSEDEGVNRPLHFQITGEFPYGVYQSFSDNELSGDGSNKTITGPLRRANGVDCYIPASSLKGILRHEFRKLLYRMTADISTSSADAAVNAMEEALFGNQEQMGKVTVSDMELKEATSIKMNQLNNDSKNLRLDQIGKGELAQVWGSLEEVSVGRNPVYIKVDRLTGSVLGSALKHQNEVSGRGEWSFTLSDDREESPFIFPLLYIIRRIGAGKVPIGGRTVIGLGQFYADSIVFTDSQGRSDIIHHQTWMHEHRAVIHRHYEVFRTWIKQCVAAQTGRADDHDARH